MQILGWPATSAEELEVILAKLDDTLTEKVVRAELSYYKHTHASDIRATPELFRLIGISHDERLENLCILLGGDHSKSTKCVDDLPNNESLRRIVLNTTTIVEVHEAPQISQSVGQMCVVVWNVNNNPQWYLGYIIREDEKNKAKVTVEHLIRTIIGNNR